jgi:stress response protein YsnF
MTTDTTIISTFDDTEIASKAMKALRDEGFRAGDLKILQGSTDDLVSELVERGFDKDEARGLAEAAEQGKTLLAALVSEDKADRAASIMDRFEAAPAEKQDKVTERRSTESVPVVEEELVVGKAKVATGGVRVTSKVKEQPIEETVTLRDKHVSAEQQPADRELSADEAEAAFEEKTVEVIGTAEEAVVSKEARVVGEVVLNQSVEEHAETVRDTVRKTDVKVEEVGTKAPEVGTKARKGK